MYARSLKSNSLNNNTELQIVSPSSCFFLLLVVQFRFINIIILFPFHIVCVYSMTVRIDPLSGLLWPLNCMQDHVTKQNIEFLRRNFAKARNSVVGAAAVAIIAAGTDNSTPYRIPCARAFPHTPRCP